MRGTRVFDGRHYILANRGPKAEMAALATRLRPTHYVRVVPWNPFFDAALRALLDDYAVFTFPKEAHR
jgi:hypothetical protein